MTSTSFAGTLLSARGTSKPDSFEALKQRADMGRDVRLKSSDLGIAADDGNVWQFHDASPNMTLHWSFASFPLPPANRCVEQTLCERRKGKGKRSVGALTKSALSSGFGFRPFRP